MKKILITGGGGFIGKNLVEKLNHEYIIMNPGKEELDLCDTFAVENYLRNHTVDIVIHTANYGARDTESALPSDVLNNGLRMFFNLARCNHLYERMYYFGSGAEYDREHYIPYMTEDYFGKYVPKDAYGFYKYILANYCTDESNIYDLRLFGIYGKYEQWRYRFISSNICRVLKGLPMTLSQNMYFDYIYIDDLANIMKWFIENKPKYHHYNVCRGTHIDLYSLGNIIKDTLKTNCDFLVANEGYKLEYSGNNTRLISEIGAYTFTPYETTIRFLKDYYLGIIDSIDAGVLP